MSDELALRVDGKELSGWTELTVIAGIERMPNSFSVSATESSPYYADAAGVREGAPCSVYLGSDRVITGYVDTVASAFGPGSHAVRISGRGKCQDLVDCSAEWKGCQVSGSNALEIAQKLAKPYGITARCIGDPGPTVPQFNINVTDTPAAILELVTRHAALLYYEDDAGQLVLADAGDLDAASGFAQGQNVQAAAWTRSQAQRYSEYVCSLLSVETSALFTEKDGLFFDIEPDVNVTRHRRLVIVAEGVMGGLDLAKRRAQWEAARRAGRSRAVTVTVDSWRDRAGKLWTPNTVAPVTLPKLGLTGVSWLISEVAFKLSEASGKTAEVKLMPRESFLPEPILLQPQIVGVIGPEA